MAVQRGYDGEKELFRSPETGKMYGYGTCGDDAGWGCGALGNLPARWLKEQGRWELFCNNACYYGH